MIIKNESVEKIYLLTLGIFITIALSSFVSMRMGLFNIFIPVAFLFLFMIIVFLKNKINVCTDTEPAQSNYSLNMDRVNLTNVILFILLFSALIFYALYPTYYMLGGRDPGLYLLYSAHISNTGGLNLNLPILNDIHALHGNAVRIGFPGIYSAYQRGLSDDPTELIPQFMHLFPAIGAIFYELAGIEGVVRTNAFISVFSLFSFFMFTRRLTGSTYALLATLALALNAAYIWNSRITLTETLAIALLFSGLYLLMKAYDLRSALWAAASGAVLGLAVLNRVDSVFNVLIILGVAGMTLVRPIDLKVIFLPLTAAYLIFSTWGFLDGYLHTYPYFYDLWTGGSLKKLFFLNYGALALSALALILVKYWPLKDTNLDALIQALMKIAIILLGAWFFFAMFIWQSFDDSFNVRSLYELSWYVTPIIFVFSLYGLWQTIILKNQQPILLSLMIMAICVFFVFTWRPSISPDHVWASRRWVPQVIPLLIVFATFGLKVFLLGDSFKLSKRTGVSIFIIYYFGNSIAFASPYLFVSIMEGSRQSYEAISSSIEKHQPKDSLIFTRNTQLASILTYVYGKETLLISDKDLSSMKEGNFNGHMLVGMDEFSRGSHILLQPGQVKGLYLEKKIGLRPKSLYLRSYSAGIGIINTTGKVNYNYRVSASHRRFGSRVGIIDNISGTVRSTGSRGWLLFGPYISVPAGSYQVTWYGQLNKLPTKVNEVGFVDVVSNKGRDKIVRKEILQSELNNRIVGQIQFKVDTHVTDLEYRYQVYENVDLTISEVVFEQIIE
jgi:hypothetical protein